MKITKRQLRRIIKEELGRVIYEQEERETTKAEEMYPPEDLARASQQITDGANEILAAMRDRAENGIQPDFPVEMYQDFEQGDIVAFVEGAGTSLVLGVEFDDKADFDKFSLLQLRSEDDTGDRWVAAAALGKQRDMQPHEYLMNNYLAPPPKAMGPVSSPSGSVNRYVYSNLVI